MFSQPTVFILGAGASWHYGYPTGEGLVNYVIDVAQRFASYCENRIRSGQVVQLVPDYVQRRVEADRGTNGARKGWERVRDECLQLIDRLATVRPLVIDYFLAWNESLREIGKLMISAVILECEAEWLSVRANRNRRRMLENAPKRPSQEELDGIDITKYQDDWHRFVVHKLVYGCGRSEDLHKNNVHFITFNYDTSLEFQLLRALAGIDLVRADAEAFFSNDRVAHVYGSVHPGIPTGADAVDFETIRNLGRPFDAHPDFQKDFGMRKVLLDRCMSAAANIRTIDPHEKVSDQVSLERTRQLIAEAEMVYILGYGFDANNTDRIGLEVTPGQSGRVPKLVKYTNYQDVLTITKRASALFNRWDSAEFSTRTVYEAIEKDFDALGSEVMPEGHI